MGKSVSTSMLVYIEIFTFVGGGGNNILPPTFNPGSRGAPRAPGIDASEGDYYQTI